MTNEERDLIARFIARVGGSPQGGSFIGGGGSVPSTQAALPPIDRDADAFIAQQFQQYPEARYRITQTAVVQEAALAEAQNRIQRLQWELEQTRNAAQQAGQGGGQRSGGFFSNLFGGGGQQQRPGYGAGGPQWGGGYQPTTPPPQPQYAPGYQPGMFQRGGSGFLGSALTTAAGVAGGMVVGNALMNAFEGHHDSGMASNSPWGGGSGGDPFNTAGVVPTDPTAGFADAGGGGADVFGQGGSDGGGWGSSGNFDVGSNDAGGFDAGGGGFDTGGFDNT